MNWMKISKYLGLIVFFAIPYMISAADGVAVVLKVKGSVEIRSNNEKDFDPASPGIILFEGDQIRVGFDGSTVIIYLHDKSMLKVKQNMEKEILTPQEIHGISKKKNNPTGMIKVEAHELQTDGFVFCNSTSVASVKG